MSRAFLPDDNVETPPLPGANVRRLGGEKAAAPLIIALIDASGKIALSPLRS